MNRLSAGSSTYHQGELAPICHEPQPFDVGEVGWISRSRSVGLVGSSGLLQKGRLPLSAAVPVQVRVGLGVFGFHVEFRCFPVRSILRAECHGDVM